MNIDYQSFYKKSPQEFTKEEAKILVESPEIPCKIRGETLLTTSRYIKEKYGQEGFEKFKKELEKLGYPIDFEKIHSLDWYPIGLRVLCLIAAVRVFGWKEKEIIEFGWNQAKMSFIVKFFFKYFLSKRTAWEKASHYWQKHYTTGKLEPIEFNSQEKYCTIRVYESKVHPIYCIFYLGYFRRIAAYSFGNDVTIEETKCMYKGDPYHEFLFKWK